MHISVIVNQATCSFTDKGTLHKYYPVVVGGDRLPRRTFISIVAITNATSSPVTSNTAKGITSTAFHILITSILINATITYVS